MRNGGEPGPPKQKRVNTLGAESGPPERVRGGDGDWRRKWAKTTRT